MKRMNRLTKAIRAEIAAKAVKELFIPQLLEQFETVKTRIIGIVKRACENIDYENVKPYREYINWHKKITICKMPNNWENITFDDFRMSYDLPKIHQFEIPFEIPSKRDEYSNIYLKEKFNKEAVDALRPYMTAYFRAKEAYEAIKETLLNFGTVKQLEEIFPELIKYLPKTPGQTTALIPQEQINKVKKLFIKE